MFEIEFLVMHSIQQEVQQIENDCLTAFILNNANNIIIGSWMILDKNLTNYSDLRFFNIGQRQIIKLLAYLPADPLVILPVAGPAVCLRNFIPFFI